MLECSIVVRRVLPVSSRSSVVPPEPCYPVALSYATSPWIGRLVQASWLVGSALSRVVFPSCVVTRASGHRSLPTLVATAVGRQGAREGGVNGSGAACDSSSIIDIVPLSSPSRPTRFSLKGV